MKREALNLNSWRELVQRTMIEQDISYEEALEFVKQKFPEIAEEVGIDELVNVDALNLTDTEDVLNLPDTEIVSLQELSDDNTSAEIIAKQIVNKWLCKALDKNDGEMVRNACIVLKAIERKAYADSLDISVTEDNGVYKVEAKSSYNNYEDFKVCYISKKSDGNLYVKFHEFSGLNGHLEGDSDYWGLNFALGAPSWMITSQEHEWDNVISKIVNKLHSENLTTNA